MTETRRELLKDLEKLRDMTTVLENLPSYNPSFLDEDRLMHLETVYGSAYSIGVYCDKHTSIAKMIFKADTMLIEHYHPQLEIICVLEGELMIVATGEDGVQMVTVLKQYESMTIQPKVIHHCKNVKPTIVMATLMPYSSHFPKPV